MALALKSGEIHYLRLKSKVILIDPAKNDVQTLMRFIFEKQVDLKKKGLYV